MTGPLPGPGFTVTGLPGLPEVVAGTDLATLIAGAAPGLADGDILVVTSKIVSKAEGRVVTGDRETAIDAETVRVVAQRGPARIVETRHGLVLAAAGVDNSNTEPGTVALLPEDPDGSARRIRKGLHERLGVTVAVLITDTMGRPWRMGQTDAAIGAAGLQPLNDYRGLPDTFGVPLQVTLAAVADELASAADLVKGKTSGIPVALVRGLGGLVTEADGPGAQALIRPAAEDMFRLGAADVLAARRTVREFTATRSTRTRSAGPSRPRPPRPPRTTPRRRASRCCSRCRPGPGCWTTCWPPGSPTCGADGFTEEQMAAGCGAGSRSAAPRTIVPCLVAERRTPTRTRGGPPPSARCSSWRLGRRCRTCWSPWPSRDWARAGCRAPCSAGRCSAALGLPAGWDPMGAVGVGRPAAPARDRPPRDPDDFMMTL